MNDIDPHRIPCRQVVERVTDYLEGALSPEELIAFEQHVVMCHGCSATLANIRAVERATRRLAVQELDDALFQKLSSVLQTLSTPT